MFKKTIILFFTVLPLLIHAQFIPVDDNSISKQYPFLSAIFNRIFNGSSLDSFYKKLSDEKKSQKGVINIVHIGDSHIQEDYFTGALRKDLQAFFGNAGRGLVFPYTLAHSEPLIDFKSSSNISWKYNNLGYPENSIPNGVAGFVITSPSPGGAVTMNFSNPAHAFNKLSFFLDTVSTWILKTPENAPPYTVSPPSPKSFCRTIKLDQPSGSFTLQSLPSGFTKSFYGVSLENSSPGILYHVIGVISAQFSSFNNAPLFWQQLKCLEPDLYIISLGANDADNIMNIDRDFTAKFSQFINNLRIASPKAQIIITTTPDSFRGNHPNEKVSSLNNVIFNYCTKNNIPLWDFYRICNGYGGVYNWKKYGLLETDGVHFTSAGYRLEGQLLFNAIAHGYNSYLGVYPP